VIDTVEQTVLVTEAHGLEEKVTGCEVAIAEAVIVTQAVCDALSL